MLLMKKCNLFEIFMICKLYEITVIFDNLNKEKIYSGLEYHASHQYKSENRKIKTKILNIDQSYIHTMAILGTIN